MTAAEAQAIVDAYRYTAVNASPNQYMAYLRAEAVLASNRYEMLIAEHQDSAANPRPLP